MNNEPQLDIRAIRRQLGLTQHELCALLARSHNVVGGWERGEYRIPASARRVIERLVAEHEARHASI